MAYTSPNVVLEVIRIDDACQRIDTWYLQPKMTIRESLAYAFKTPMSTLVSTGLYVTTDYGQDPIIDSDPLFDYTRFLDFEWYSYGIYDYVVQANVEIL